MEDLIASKPCNLRRIDIAKWGSDVAKQFGIRRLPTVWLYNGEDRVSADTRDIIGRLKDLD